MNLSFLFSSELTVIAFAVGLSIAAQVLAIFAGVVSRGGSGVGVAVGVGVGVGVGSPPPVTVTLPVISARCVEQ